MKINLMNQFGKAGVADAGAFGRARQNPVSMGHLTATPEGVPGTAGEEQLR